MVSKNENRFRVYPKGSCASIPPNKNTKALTTAEREGFENR